DVYEEQHHIALGYRRLDLGPDRAVQRVGRVRHHASRIHQPKPSSVPLDGAEVPIARDARTGVHDRLPASDEPIEQRRLADVGAADDGNSGGAALHPCPSPNAECGVWNAELNCRFRVLMPACGVEAGTSIPHSAFPIPHSVSTSAKSYDRRTGIGTRAASSLALRSSTNTRSSFTASAGSSTKSRSPRSLSARSTAAPGRSPAVVTEGPNRVFSTTTSSKRPPVVAATSASTCGINGPMALPVTTPMRLPARSGSRSTAAAILVCRNRTEPTPFSRCSKSPYHAGSGSRSPAWR